MDEVTESIDDKSIPTTFDVEASINVKAILFAVITVFVAVILLGGVNTILSETLAQDTYSVVIDAGSTGSRVSVFHFRTKSTDISRVVLEEEVFQSVEPGISFYSYNPIKAVETLQPLLHRAIESVPRQHQPLTLITFKATAGLRLLPRKVADRIISVVRELLQSTPFYLPDPSSVEIMSGEDEGVSVVKWLNHLSGILKVEGSFSNCIIRLTTLWREKQPYLIKPGAIKPVCLDQCEFSVSSCREEEEGQREDGCRMWRMISRLVFQTRDILLMIEKFSDLLWKSQLESTVTIFDLGGGSVQVAFEISEMSGFTDSLVKDIIKLLLLKSKFSVFTKSYLGYGLKSARLGIMGGKEGPDGMITYDSNISDKIDTSVLLLSPCYPMGTDFTFVHNDFNYIVKGKNAVQYVLKDCRTAVDKFVQAANFIQNSEMSQRDIHLFSYFFDVARWAELITWKEHIQILTPNDFYNAATKYCHQNNFSHKHPFLCVDLLYVHSLLTVGAGLRPDTKMSVESKLLGREVSWTLGAALCTRTNYPFLQFSENIHQ